MYISSAVISALTIRFAPDTIRKRDTWSSGILFPLSATFAIAGFNFALYTPQSCPRTQTRRRLWLLLSQPYSKRLKLHLRLWKFISSGTNRAGVINAVAATLPQDENPFVLLRRPLDGSRFRRPYEQATQDTRQHLATRTPQGVNLPAPKRPSTFVFTGIDAGELTSEVSNTPYLWKTGAHITTKSDDILSEEFRSFMHSLEMTKRYSSHS
jgi:hypothetical protein